MHIIINLAEIEGEFNPFLVRKTFGFILKTCIFGILCLADNLWLKFGVVLVHLCQPNLRLWPVVKIWCLAHLCYPLRDG